MSRGPDKQFDPDVALGQAMRLFWAKGYAATGMAELLETMGIARKSLYDTFGNKRQLFVQALGLYARQELGAIESELSREGSPIKNLRRVLNRWQEMNSEQGSCGCMLGNNTAHFEVDDAEMADLLRRHYDGLERAFRATLERAQELGEIGPDARVRDLARMLVATGQGLALIARTHDDGAVARSVVRATLAAVEAA